MGLDFHNITFAYTQAPVLRDVSLQAGSGKITCLLGPSGCGKTTLMKLAAGILPMQGGEISLDSAVIATQNQSPPPEKRPIGVVFQEGALFPHLTVGQNVGFGLKDKSVRDQRVSDLLDQVGLSNFGDRYPDTLSGGQQQRVALARALAPAPQVLLLDEPFANIDILLRKSLRAQTRALLKGSDRVVMLVTHDPEEALEMADDIAVLSQGALVQSGSPQALYAAPQTLSVATLIGEAQSIEGVISDAGIETRFGLWPPEALSPLYKDLRGPVDLAIRDGDLRACEGDAVLVDMRGLRGDLQMVVRAGGETLTLLGAPDAARETGSAMSCVPRAATLMAFAKPT